MTSIVLTMPNEDYKIQWLARPIEIADNVRIVVSISSRAPPHGVLFCNLARPCNYGDRYERVLAICDADAHLSVRAQQGAFDHIALHYEPLDDSTSAFSPITVFITFE